MPSTVFEASCQSDAHDEGERRRDPIARLHDLFGQTAGRFPERIAVSCRGQEWTYQDLDLASNRLARLLRARGVERGDHVGLFLPRGAEVYVALLAILKTGAAYVPLDPDYPPDRVAYILGDCQARALVTTADLSVALTSYPGVVVPLDALSTTAALEAESDAPIAEEQVGATAEDVCYVIYTSGSTGRPKGVAIEHRSACHLVQAESAIFQVGPEDRVYQGFSIAFDASIEEIWLAFFVGATLVCGTREMVQTGPGIARLLTEAGVTVLSTVPTLLALIEDEMPSVRLLILGGEQCPQELVSRWCRPGRRLVNTYGPTEATVIATFCECAPERPVSIGRAVPGYRVYLLDERMRPVPPGTPGEIHIGGPGVARGYVGKPELTRERFVESPFQGPEDPWPRLYKSGDLGRLNAAGEIEFVGRIDAQVKLRGFRIELTEIESVLLEAPGVRAAVVALREDTPGVPRLIGYLVPRNDDALDARAIREAVRARLPSYMIPAHFERLDRLPTLPSGKVDRAALPAPGASLEATPLDGESLGGGEVARTLATAWGRLFAPAQVALDDDFFRDLGGHSLLAARMVSELRVEPAFRSLSVLDVYNHPTIARLAAKIERDQQKEETTPSTPAPTFQAPSKWTYRRCVAAQTAGLYVILGVFSLQWLAPYLTYTYLIENDAAVFEAILGALAALLIVYPVMLGLSIASKWLVVGRFRAGTYPLWGGMFFRWWFVNAMNALVPIDYMAGTPLLNWYYRLLGAKVGPNVHFGSDALDAFDLASVGADTCIGTDVHMAGTAVKGGWLEIGPVTVGRGCRVGNATVLEPGAVMEDGSQLDDLSALPRGARIPTRERWGGAPARFLARRPMGVDPGVERPGLGKRFAFGMLHLLGLFVFPVLVIAAIFPGLIAMNELNYRDEGYAYLVVSPLVAMSFVILLCLEIAAVKWLLLGRVKPGKYPLHSGFYLRKWFVDQMLDLSLDVIGPLYATIYLTPWYRLLGATLGRRAEISTASFLSPDLLTLGEESFIADAVSLGAARVEEGYVTVDEVHVGRRSFIGNSALLPPGAHIGDNCLIGVLSTTPDTTPGASAEGTSWLGSPAVFLPQRQASATFQEEQTYRPSRKLQLQRAAIEFVRVTLPLSCFIALTCVFLSVYLLVHDTISTLTLLLAFPLLYGAFGVVAALIVVAVKWLLVGRYRPTERPLWSTFVWKTELVTAMYEHLARLFLVDMLTGTPYLPAYLRTLGAKIGKRVFLDSAEVTEFDLVSIGDDAAVNQSATIQTHLFEDRVMKMSTVTIGPRCTVGSMSVVLYDSEMGADATLGSLSLLMKGETLLAGTSWEGSPARAAGRPGRPGD